MAIFQKMLELFAIMIIGYIVYRKNILTDSGCKTLSAIVVNIANPAMILGSVASGDLSGISNKDVLTTAAAAVSVFAVLIVIAELTGRIFGKGEKRGMYKAFTVFSNIGFMGFPVITSIYGKSALIYGSIFLIPFNILMYTYCIMVVRKKDGEGSSFSLKKLFNVGVIACIIMILLFFFRIKVPAVIAETLDYLGNMVVPLSMIAIGASMAQQPLKTMFTDIRLLAFMPLKLIVLPVIGIFALSMFIENTVILGVSLVILSTPVATMVSMLAREYDGDYMFASCGITLSTLLSVVTIPIVFKLTGLQ